MLAKAEKISTQIVNEKKKIVERSINKIYGNFNNEQEYAKEIKIMDLKRILLEEAVSKGYLKKRFLRNLDEEQQKLLFVALKQLNQEDILFRNHFSSYSMKEGVKSCLSEEL